MRSYKKQKRKGSDTYGADDFNEGYTIAVSFWAEFCYSSEWSAWPAVRNHPA